MPLTLASSSPRRLDLLRAAGLRIGAVHAPDIEEVEQPGEDPVAFARRMAAAKAAAVADAIGGQVVVLAADTVVHRRRSIYGKPQDDRDARRMLAALAGRWHQVSTAWALHDAAARRALTGCSTTRVRMRPLDEREIDRYVARGEGRDKAGGYGIQGLGGALVAAVEGSYTNVVGLPLDQVIPALAELGIRPEDP